MEVQKENNINFDNISCAKTNESVARNQELPLMPPSAPKLKPKMALYEVQSFVLPLSANAASQSNFSCVDDNSLMNLSNFGLPKSSSFTQGAVDLSNKLTCMTQQVTHANDNSSYQQIFEALKMQ